MNLYLRKLHLKRVFILFVFLGVFLPLAIFFRSPTYHIQKLPIQEQAEINTEGYETLVETDLYAIKGKRNLKGQIQDILILPYKEFLYPDILIYWSFRYREDSKVLPKDAYFLGRLLQKRVTFLSLQTILEQNLVQNKKEGYLYFYSLGFEEIIYEEVII